MKANNPYDLLVQLVTSIEEIGLTPTNPRINSEMATSITLWHFRDALEAAQDYLRSHE